MNRLSYIACSTIACLTAALVFAPPAPASVSPSHYSAASYLVKINDRTVLEKNPDRRLAPASLTKIMTALLIMEKSRMDEVVTVSKGAARETGSRIGLRRGERLKVRDLLAATLIASANDACRALADHAGGSQGGFVEKMNAKAKELGLANTRFANACGHDDASLYTTAHDLAVLAEHALDLPLFEELVSRKSMRISTVNGRRSFQLRNKNRLIGRYPGAYGVKTGTTPRAGQCLVALAKRDDRKVLLVLMRSQNRWKTAPAMLDAAFRVSTSAMRSREVKGGNDEALPQGALVRDQEAAWSGEHNGGRGESAVGKRHPRRSAPVQRHAHHRKRVHKRR
ncbi:D-alanyl-D-alanine carboxypeptidase [Geomonas sp. Red32]|uniref:D-alanyl-D-alanine carboxypeptidase family protein n=1 Tax=Geomonas sp. Red32 TaxID=2912856 RepID=UPI00202CF609|nr:D-alanyl-D-alanine carboxypeptidase [Geomonas sp. Red32]